jgi:hypothetical protein
MYTTRKRNGGSAHDEDGADETESSPDAADAPTSGEEADDDPDESEQPVEASTPSEPGEHDTGQGSDSASGTGEKVDR